MKKYQDRDKKALEEKNHDTNRDNKTIKKSKEVILLQNYRWVMLKNRDEIITHTIDTIIKCLA